MPRQLLWLPLVLIACKPTPPSLAERVKARIVTMIQNANVEIVDAVTLKVKGTSATQLNLDNLQLRCGEGEEACNQAIERLAANTKDIVTQGPEADFLDPAKVRLNLKPESWVKSANLMMAKKPSTSVANTLLSEPFAADVAITFVLDQPNGMRLLSTGDLLPLKLDRAQLRALALKNLGAAFSVIKMSEIPGTGVFTNDARDDYDSALLTLPGHFLPYAQKLAKGESLVVSIPARNHVFMAHAPAGVAALRKLTAEANDKEDHPISKALFKWSASGFSEYSER